MGIPVRAADKGFYSGHLREVGDKFEVEKEAHLGSWMVRLDKAGRKKPQVEDSGSEDQAELVAEGSGRASDQSVI